MRFVSEIPKPELRQISIVEFLDCFKNFWEEIDAGYKQIEYVHNANIQGHYLQLIEHMSRKKSYYSKLVPTLHELEEAANSIKNKNMLITISTLSDRVVMNDVYCQSEQLKQQLL
ncbi:MAG: hypothetical protein H6Q69_955 [Firmicutes bacterium]|nr:hypothetical protein [Bacillota bacterium]